ncbi:MAG TPA: carboxypeptidase regulatory-like domain-containing protein, partial [Terracidiphilus sp.]|nr:carboxypeptidase regulatory-like domain-containing protein [Terracidiphilus sp.]
MPFCVCVAGMGQATSGSVSGTVHDASGAVVPGATVTISDVAKGTKSVTRTDSVGSYAFPSLLPGTYTISVEMTGFKRSVQANFPLDIDQKADLDIALQTGGTSETVEVTAAPPLIKLESSELGDVVSQHQVQDLPLNGRNFAQLVYLVPGVTAGQAGENLSGSSSFNPRAASDFNSLGSQANTNQYLVDGIIDNEWTFNTVMVQPSVESVAEFKVMTGTYSAEYGGGAGIVSTSTRSGANAMHGEVFTYLRNSAVDARNYFARAGSSVQKPAYRRGQFGGAVGGAIKRDKLFYFADYYGQRSLKGIVNQNSVPTAAERNGDFSSYTNAAGTLIPIYDPLTTVQTGSTFTRTQFSCNGVLNVICPARLSQVGLNVASIYPLPQTSGSFNNFISTANQIINDNGGNARIDYHLSDKDSMFGRFSYERYVQSAPNPLVGGQGTCCLPPSATAAKSFDLGPFVAGIQNTTLVAQGLSIDETHFFSSNTFNEFRMGYARTNPFTTQSDFGHNSSTSLGMLGLNISQYTTGLPNLTIGSTCGNEFTCLQGGTAFLPANPRQTNVQFEDTFSQTRGRHGLRAGLRYVRVYASPFTNTTTRGAMTFNDNFTNSGSAAAGGSGLAGLLLGFPNSGSRNFLLVPYYDLNVQYGMFIQDDWKLSQRLTVNLGFRDDIYTPDTDKNNKLANFDYSKMAFVFAGLNGTSKSAGIQQRNNDFGPRVGLAFDLDGKGTTVIRAGFGIAYFQDPFSASDELGQNPPFTISQTFASPATFPLPAAFSNVCSPTNVTSTCQPVINNAFPQGAAPLSYATLTNTASLNAAVPAIISHSMANKTPSTQTYTLGIERQALGGVVEIAYGGSHSVHLTYAYNPNEVGLIQSGGPTSTTLRRLIQPLNNISTWVQEDPINRSNYNSLQVKYTKRYSHGLMALIDYTYGKSLDYGGSAASGGGSAGNPQTVTNLKAGYGASGFDQKHRLVSSVNYDLPFGGGKKFLNSGLVSHIAGGFEVDAITTYGSGAPFTVTLNSGVNSGSPSWPDRIASGKLDHGTPLRFYDTTAFKAPAANTYGNSARSVLYGPSTKDWDVSLQRKIKLYEDKILSFRLDAFNAFNTPNFATPVAAIGASTAGQITGTVNDNRDLQGSVTLHF